MNFDEIHKIGLISDTHGRLSAKAYDTLNGEYDSNDVYERIALQPTNMESLKLKAANKALAQLSTELIIHAGDIGFQTIIDELESICPVIAVNGNCDFQTYKTLSRGTQDFEAFEYEGCGIAVAHRPQDLENYVVDSFLSPSKVPEGLDIKLRIHGHTHEAHITPSDEGYTTICPGSASMGRYGTPNSVGFVYIKDGLPVFSELVCVE